MFANKVVLITGASSGIGAQTALDFSKLEANVVVIGRNENNLDNVAKQCQEISPKKLKPVVIVADLSCESDVEKIIRTTIDTLKKIDVLVNNAAIVFVGSIENTSLKQYDTIMNTNLRGPYYLTMLAAPHLIKAKGNIVNVSSLVGSRGFPNLLAYCISKAGLEQLTRCVALELAPKGVRVNCVSPGDTVTGLHLKGVFNDQKSYDEYIQKTCAELYPLGRPGQSTEVSAVITFLASEAASNVTGVVLPVDGGRHASL